MATDFVTDDIIPILGTSDCSWCAASLKPGDGITLKTCLHPFCTACLKSLIQSSSQEQIMCPVRHCEDNVDTVEVNNNPKTCSGYLTRNEIQYLLGPEEFPNHLERVELDIATRVSLSQNNNCRHGGYGSLDVSPERKRAKANLTQPKGQGEGGHHNNLQAAGQNTCITLADFPTTCGFCTEELPIASGIILQSCGCIFCKDCIADSVIRSKKSRVRCPRPTDNQCDGFILDSEVKSVVSEGRYQEYIERSLREAKSAIGNLFSCKTPGCEGCCEVDAASTKQIFHCPLCSKLNCVQCQVCHEGISCDRYKEIVKRATASTKKTSGPEFDTFVEEQMKSGGWEQLATLVNNANAAGSSSSAISELESYKLIPSTKPFTCQICLEVIQPYTGSGVILQECLHTCCKQCLVDHIVHSDEVQIKCPHVDPIDGSSCSSYLSPREIQALVTTPVLEQHLNRSVVRAELATPNSFHCATPNCTGWCVIEPGDVEAHGKTFYCPVCHKESCIECKVCHPGVTCHYYQLSIDDDLNKRTQAKNEKLNTEALDKELKKREVRRCPRCQFLCQKISGCDHVVCGACKFAYNWPEGK